MSKRMFFMTAVLVLLMACGSFLTAETNVLASKFQYGMSSAGEYGNWTVQNNRLYQMDTEEKLAKINFRAAQEGLMEYIFDVRYEGGGFIDRMGGFGIQVFVDDAHRGKSWGNGESFLLWLNYDEEPSYGKAGFRAQVYQSFSHSRMELIDGYDIPLNPSVLTAANMDLVIPVKIQIDGDTGLVKVWDPTREGMYVRFYLNKAPGEGSFISLRTNSLSVSFDNLTVTQLD
ncbi:MAG: hypothetical protein SVR04_18385 [Spirochaetota bacterium]|nr:hypothetical protein [Spirochaetota bacterium]